MVSTSSHLTEPRRFYKPGVPLRPERMALQVPVRYHVIGEHWYEGWTENISRNGVLIRAAEAVAPGAELDVILTLPAGVLPDFAGEIICAGTVVRLVPASGNQPAGFAAVFRQCRRTVAGLPE